MPVNSSTTLNDRYQKWDNVTSSLLRETEEEEKIEKAACSEELGQTRIPYSEAEEKERAKLEISRKCKAALDKHQERESNAIVVLENILEEGIAEVKEEMIGKRRVISLRNCIGYGTVIFPDKLSNLSISNDDLKDEMKNQFSIKGIIKIFIEKCQNCTIRLECKIITSVIEISHCSNVTIEIGKHRLSTIQTDLCDNLTLKFVDSWCFGSGKEDKIYHAGMKDMKVIMYRKSGTDIIVQKSIDYKRDGAVARFNATAEEYQFVTQFIDGELTTKPVLRINGIEVTESEFEAEKQKYGSTHEMVDVVKQCYTHKSEGNDEFKNGNYGQAVLFYTMAIDKSKGLESLPSSSKETCFNERHICYANRSACFLKLGHHDKALMDAEDCLGLDPTYIKGKFRKGLALHAMERYEEAIPVLGACLRQEPNNKQIKNALQFCEVRLEMGMRKRMGSN